MSRPCRKPFRRKFACNTCVLWIGRSIVCNVKATDLQDASTQASDATVKLRADRYRPLAVAKGHATVVSQAGWHGIARSSMFRILAGGAPMASTAARIAADLGVPFEFIWERQ